MHLNAMDTGEFGGCNWVNQDNVILADHVADQLSSELVNELSENFVVK